MAVYCGQYYQNIFPWAKYKIFMGKHEFQWPTTARFRSEHMFSLSKYVTLWQTYFHGQSATFSWAKCNIFMGKVQRFHGQTCYITACTRLASDYWAELWINRTCTSVASRQCPSCNFFRVEWQSAAAEKLWNPLWEGPWSGWSWTKASLPSRRGGIDLRSVSIQHSSDSNWKYT